MSDLDELKRRVERLEQALFPVGHPAQQYVPPIPATSAFTRRTCQKCGTVLDGAMGYVCPASDCPIMPKAS